MEWSQRQFLVRSWLRKNNYSEKEVSPQSLKFLHKNIDCDLDFPSARNENSRFGNSTFDKPTIENSRFGNSGFGIQDLAIHYLAIQDLAIQDLAIQDLTIQDLAIQDFAIQFSEFRKFIFVTR